MSDALYDGPNRVIIDDNTPETNSLPISGGKGVDEFLITRTANSVVIDDDSEANVIVFERDVVITSIERQAGSEGASVAQYVITLSSGKTITLRNPANFTFQHLGDATRTAPISAEDFFTAYEDGFAASDASHPDIIGDASGPSGVQGPMITSDPPTASQTEDEIDPVTGTLNAGGLPIIQRSSLTYNPDETSITIDETMLKVTSGNASDPTLLVYTITTLPDAGMLLKSGTQLNNGDTFTQADINNGLIVYQPSVSSLSTSQSNPLSFTLSDGEADGLMETLQITSRKVVGNTASAQDNTVDFSEVDVPQKIEAGDGSDIITGGDGNDQIDGAAGDDEIKLTRTVNNVEEDAGADEVLYTFGYDGVGIDGGDEIVGFKRGQDKVTFVVQDSRQFANLEEFLGSLKGVDDEDLTADDAFIATLMWGLDENGVFYFDGVLLHFKEGTSFGGGRVSSPVVQITFDQRLDFDDLVEILGGAEKAADNFDFTHAAFKNLDEVLPRLFGESSIDFVVLPFSNSISVIDGPVTGAEVFFDIDDDGEVSDVEKNAQRDASGRSLYITGDDGSVSIPKKYVGRAFVAVVDSAYDIGSGERLEGEFRSLDKGRGGIATPITDLIVTYLEEVEGLTNIPANAPITEQGVLNVIFSDTMVMVADILDMGNYKVPESGAPGEVKKQMIIRAAIALAEIKKDGTLAGGDGNAPVTKAEIIETIQVLLALPDDSSIARLKDAVDARVGEAVAVKGGKPIGIPDDVETTEDTDYEFPETLVDLIELFGFLDPSGNSSSAKASAFRGVYIKVAIENGVLSLDDNTPVVESTAGLGDVSVPSITGYIYITRDKLDTLKLRPALDFNGNLELIYRVWDGEKSSSDVTLTITVTSVNDDPVATGSRIVGQNGQVDHAITAIDLSALFTDIDDEIVTLDVFFFDSSIKEVYIGLYNVADRIIGRPTRSGLYTIEVVASDNRGGEATLEFPILILPDVESLTKVSGNGGVNAVVSNDEATSSQFLTGGDNAQTLNAGDAGDLIFGGRGDDIINLGDGMDIVIYRYDGADKTDSAAYDGGDVINNFNLSKDILVLAHVGGNVHNNAAAFFDAIKGFSLLVNDNGNITGIVFIFTDRETQTQDIDLTLNFEESISSEDIDLTAFNAAVDGRRAVKRGQETIAYQALESATEGDGLALINFKDIDFINEIDDATPPSQIPIGDNNIQTLNYGAGGNLIFGGRGDDIINLGDGRDDVFYRYDGVDDSDSAAFDGGDVINNFDLDEDLLLLFHAEGNIHDDIATFFDAIKSVSLLDSGGKITGIVFTFIDRAEGADDDAEIDLTVNLENDDFISSENIDLTAFNEVEIGKWTIKTGQETAAYETIIDDVFRSALRLSSFFIVSGYGVNGVTIGDEAATSRQLLLGGDNVQTLNAGTGGDDIVGGKDDDIINLGGGWDSIFYGYDGTDKTDSAAYDGGDVINNFDLDRDQLRLLHVGNNVHSNTAEFYAAIKGVSLLVGVINEDEVITGIMFTFTDRDTPTEEIDLTVNFENADFIFPEITALTAFNEEVSGRRTIKTGQEIAAYQVIDAVLDNNLYLYNFARHKPPSPSQILIGDDNIQTLNYGAAGNLIFGGRGDDIINLGDGRDDVYYRYDGADKTDSAAFDGADVINNFDLDKDRLRLHHAEGNLHYDDDITTFFYAIKGVSLLDSGGKITGIVFTFIDRAEGADDDAEIDLTVNLENDDFISSENIDLTAFNEVEIGKWTIKTGQETAAYETIIDDVFRSALRLSSFFIVSGYGVNGVTIGDEAATSGQLLLGGDNVQTLNAGTGGDDIFGGKDDDIINLGAGYDYIFYGYDGADKTDSAAYDGGDVINNFDLDRDQLRLLHVGNNVHSSTAEFYAAIKGVSLLVGVGNRILLVEENKILYEDEVITGIVFTFTDRDTPTEEIDLTVNFENADFIFPEITDLTAFNEEVSGRRTIKTGQEDAAYEVIDAIFVGTLFLYNFGNNAPVVDIAIGTQRVTVDLPITAIDLEYIFFDYEDGFELTLTVTLDDGTALSTIGLTYDSDEDEITGTLTRTGTYVIKIVATDKSGATVETTFDIVVSALDRSGVIREDDEELRGTLGDAERILENGIGAFGEIRVESGGLQTEWIYTPDDRAEVLSEGESVTEKFTFMGGDGVDDVVITITVVGANDDPEIDTPLGIQRGTVDQGIIIDVNNLFTDIDRSDELTLTFTVILTGDTEATLDDIGLTYNEVRDEITNEITSRRITGDPDAGMHRIKAVADDGNGGTVETTFTIQVSSFSSATLGRELGRGVDGAVVNGVSTRAEEFLIGGDNDQTLNTGRDGDYVFGGRGNDTIDLGNGEDVVYYRYGGDDDGLEGIDGHDVIEDFDLDEDFLVLARVGNGIHGEAAAFDDAIRFSTTPNSEGEITGFVITFTGGGSLTVNFDSDPFISDDDQSPNPSLSTVLLDRLQLIHFDNIGFKLNSAETNIIASPDITRLINQSGNGVDGAEVGADDASESQFLIGGDNAQTLNASSRGDVIFGGRGDDTINLGSGDDVVYYRYNGVDTDDLVSIDGNDTIEDFDRGDDVLVLAYVGDDGGEIIDTTDFYGALKSIKLLVEEDDDDDLTGIVFTFTDRSDNAGANDEVVLTVNFNSVFSASSSQIRTIDNAFEDAASGSEERLVKSGEEDDALAVIEDIVLGEDLQLINFADIGFKLNAIETNAVVLPNVFTFAKELGDGDDNASVGVATAASSQFLLGGDNDQILNAGTEGDAIFGGNGDDIINLGDGKDFVFYRYDGDDTDDTDDSEASDGADEINDFDLDEDVLVLVHESNEVHENANAFYGAIKGISLLVDGDGDVTGIVFTFTDRSNTTQEVDLTVNFEGYLTPPAGLEAAFENASSGEREITSGQETAAYRVINEIFGDNLVLIDFDDIGFELNTAETDIV